jgi:hypothetical protein
MIAVVAALGLAACGGGSSAKASTSGSATTTTAGGGAGLQNSAFTACLKQHGVTLPAGFGGGGRRGGSGGPGGFGGRGGSGPRGPRGGSGGRGFLGGGAGLSAAQQTAFTACRSKLPNGGRFGGGGGGFAGGASATQLKAYMSCLSDNGVKVPTTTSAPAGGSGARRFGNPLAGLRNDPHFATASQKCAPLLPARGTRTPSSPAAG